MKDKYTVFFVSNVNGVNKWVAKKNVRLGKKEVTYKKGAWPIDFSQVVFSKGQKNYLIIDIDKGQVKLEGHVPTLSKEINDLLLVRKTAAHFISTIQIGMGFGWIPIVIGLCIGLPIGLLIGAMFLGSMIGGSA